jgi:hypothetical protein
MHLLCHLDFFHSCLSKQYTSSLCLYNLYTQSLHKFSYSIFSSPPRTAVPLRGCKSTTTNYQYMSSNTFTLAQMLTPDKCFHSVQIFPNSTSFCFLFLPSSGLSFRTFFNHSSSTLPPSFSVSSSPVPPPVPLEPARPSPPSPVLSTPKRVPSISSSCSSCSSGVGTVAVNFPGYDSLPSRVASHNLHVGLAQNRHLAAPLGVQHHSRPSWRLRFFSRRVTRFAENPPPFACHSVYGKVCVTSKKDCNQDPRQRRIWTRQSYSCTLSIPRSVDGILKVHIPVSPSSTVSRSTFC